ncbi:MAG: trehalose utilization protein ThuA [Rhodothermales bacterium]|nr:trehalose utilization protein ThuA [Rhodothermales bacterium]
MNITVWNEYRHEKQNPDVKEIYPNGIHHVIAESLRERGLPNVLTATLDEPDHGLSPEVLNQTDVLIWWGHKAHDEVDDDIVERVRERVLAGMGLVALHSAHHAKIFKRLMGTSCSLRWRESNEKERIWVVKPGHPVADGIDMCIELERTEMYGEFFDIPVPDELVFISSFEGGEVFRSGCCFHRGYGKIFYFRPGHETLPIYHNIKVQQVIANAVSWARPTAGGQYPYPAGAAIHAV